jgi:DNA primase small subunit
MQNIERDIIFQYCYPRLDDKVTTQINHLLKSPFCVHPSTGRVCVPIVPSECDNFDPFKVPKLSDLVQEIEAYDAANPVAPGDAPRVPGWCLSNLI